MIRVSPGSAALASQPFRETEMIFTFDDSLISSSATFTLLQADGGITGAFSNIASGGRLDAFFFGASEPSGSFRVDYTGNALTISDYQRVPTSTSMQPKGQPKF